MLRQREANETECERRWRKIDLADDAQTFPPMHSAHLNCLPAVLLLLGPAGLLAGPDAGSVSSGSSKFPCPESEIARYTAYRVSQPVRVDGMLNEPFYERLPWSPRFIDIISGQPTVHGTRAAVFWDEDNLYVAYRIEEPLVHAKFTARNSPIYYDNDVELFIAGKDAYYELELNALNTRYEAFFIWNDAYETGGFAAAPEFRRARMRPFNGVGFTTHPRGGRLGAFDWTLPGLQHAVHVDGTLNQDKDRDRGWTVELRLPWKGMKWIAQGDDRSLPPKDGDVWRMDFSRFNQYKAAPPNQDSGGWVWTRHGVWDSHIPECFARIRFSSRDAGSLQKVEAPAGQRGLP
jgi:hypothetical protein